MDEGGRRRREDARLIEAARGGDEGAFEALYRRHRGYVLAVALRFGAPEPEALDVLQEVFVYLLGKLARLELRTDLRAFLYPVAKHLALKRTIARRRTLPLGPEHAERPAPEPMAGPLQRVEELVAGLPRKHREVVLLRFSDGMTLEEIAAALGVRLGTVKSRLHHALRRLRASLEG